MKTNCTDTIHIFPLQPRCTTNVLGKVQLLCRAILSCGHMTWRFAQLAVAHLSGDVVVFLQLWFVSFVASCAFPLHFVVQRFD